jgi:hypothetical protein
MRDYNHIKRLYGYMVYLFLLRLSVQLIFMNTASIDHGTTKILGNGWFAVLLKEHVESLRHQVLLSCVELCSQYS